MSGVQRSELKEKRERDKVSHRISGKKPLERKKAFASCGKSKLNKAHRVPTKLTSLIGSRRHGGKI